MAISRRMAAGIVTGFLLSTSVPAFAQSHDVQSDSRAINDAAITCEPLSWDAANKLPWFIKASDVECMSPTQGDLQASAQARNLLATAAVHMQNDRPTSGSSTETEYNDGIAAYAEGRYIAAIDHFRAAVPATNR
jgi:TolA-binding protein